MIGFVLSVVLFLGAAACDGTSSEPRPKARTAPTATSDATSVPPPGRACGTSVYSGVDANAVDRSPGDVVVGPVRLARLAEHTELAGQPVLVDGDPYYGVKVPLTVEATSLDEVVLEAHSDDGTVLLAYDDAPGVALTFESAIPCGHGPAGFAQYNGGVLVRRPVCARMTATTSSGEALGRAEVAIGPATC